MKQIFITVAFIVCTTLVFAQSKLSQKAKKPNIVFILSDDAGYADFSFQSDRLISTPNIDRIANEGVKFTNGYVTGAVCSPSRAGILTGINQVEFGYVYNLPDGDLGLPVSQKLIGNYLKPLGYTTGIVGKWHEGKTPQFHPNQRGFDYFWGFLGGNSPYFNGLAKEIQENGVPVPASSISYMTDAIGEKSVQFIEKNAKEPFFLYVAFNAPHTPMHAKPELLEKYINQFDSKGRATNAAMTKSLDENVGKILSKLKELNLLDNTLIVFTSDNGGEIAGKNDNGEDLPQNFSNNYPLRGRKAGPYEGGIRVPMAMMWKGKMKPGLVFNSPVSTLDFLPTFLAAAGAKTEKFPQLQGIDLVKQTTMSANNNLSRPFYWYIGYNDTGVIRLDNYKMIFSANKNPELYDLNNDIGETTDLYQSKPEVVNKLADLYKSWRNKLPAPLWKK